MSLPASTLFLNAIQHIASGHLASIDAAALRQALDTLPPEDSQKKKSSLLSLAVSSSHPGSVDFLITHNLLPAFAQKLRINAQTLKDVKPQNVDAIASILHADIQVARKSPKDHLPMFRRLWDLANTHPNLKTALLQMGMEPQNTPPSETDTNAPFSFSFFRKRAANDPDTIAKALLP